VTNKSKPPVHELEPVSVARILRMSMTFLMLVGTTLGIGTFGYHWIIPDLPWIDAFHQASMLLSGMGPVFPESIKLSDGAKIFDSLYALFCGVVLLASTAILFAPFLHRLLHRMHVEDARDADR
jgi:hypothetical protein